MMLVSSYLSSRAGRQSASLLRKCTVTRFNKRSRDSSSSTADTEWNTIEKIAASLKDGKYKRILIVAGAGVSCSAGIPDFRTPGTGIYDNLQKYNLPYPESIFVVQPRTWRGTRRWRWDLALVLKAKVGSYLLKVSEEVFTLSSQIEFTHCEEGCLATAIWDRCRRREVDVMSTQQSTKIL